MKNNITVGENVAVIHLVNKAGDSYRALIDIGDVEKISMAKAWYVLRGTIKKKVPYCYGVMQDGSRISLHRLIMDCKSGEIVDHINGDGLDNRKSNLRIVTNSENAHNIKMNSNNASGVTGVRRKDNKWIALIMVEGKEHSLGIFKSIEDAKKELMKFREDHGMDRRLYK